MRLLLFISCSCICIVCQAPPDRYLCILFSCLFSIISHVALIIWHFEWLYNVHASHPYAERTISQCSKRCVYAQAHTAHSSQHTTYSIHLYISECRDARKKNCFIRFFFAFAKKRAIRIKASQRFIPRGIVTQYCVSVWEWVTHNVSDFPNLYLSMGFSLSASRSEWHRQLILFYSMLYTSVDSVSVCDGYATWLHRRKIIVRFETKNGTQSTVFCVKYFIAFPFSLSSVNGYLSLCSCYCRRRRRHFVDFVFCSLILRPYLAMVECNLSVLGTDFSGDLWYLKCVHTFSMNFR